MLDTVVHQEGGVTHDGERVSQRHERNSQLRGRLVPEWETVALLRERGDQYRERSEQHGLMAAV